MTTIFKTPAAAVQHREDGAAAQDFAQLKSLAERNDPVAQYRLAASYERGRGVARDLGLAELWYGRAAARGNVLAMHNLGSLHAAKSTKNRQQSNRLAVVWFQKAAQYGLADSEYNLGLIMEKGLGVAANPVEAYKWYSLAAAAGDREAAGAARRWVSGCRLLRSSTPKGWPRHGSRCPGPPEPIRRTTAPIRHNALMRKPTRGLCTRINSQ